MNVVITTFSQYNNYGSRLQNFALCKVIQSMGEDPVTLLIDNPKENFYSFLKNILSMLPLLNKRQRKWKNERKKQTAFQRFNKSLNIKRLSFSHLQKFCKDSIAIAGSDQIWSPYHIERCPKDAALYFLQFVPPERRYAYAPSFGVEEIPDKLSKRYKEYLSKFALLSARENTGVKIIKKLTGSDASVMPDPTFLMSKEEWLKTAKESRAVLPKNKYLLTYFLSDQSVELWSGIYDYAHLKNATVVRIAGNQYTKGETVPAPDAFVAFVSGAEAVFTDSFHGCVFSIILQRPFTVFHRTDVDQFSRIENLLEKYGLEVAFCREERKPVQYDAVFGEENFTLTAEIMETERSRGIDYLTHIVCK